MKPYTHFTLEERESLYLLLILGKKVSEIAKELGRSKSTISREIRRNQNYRQKYTVGGAEYKYFMRRKKSRRKNRLSVETDLYTYISERLKKFWSPEQIALKWNKENPDRKISHSTIYLGIKRGLFANIEAKTHLRRRGKRKSKKTNHATIKPTHTIHERPNEANLRLRFGDWEGDLICGGTGKGCVITMTDRKTRFLITKRIRERSAKTVTAAIISMMQGICVHSITLDNGPEFAGFLEIDETLNTIVYFADPHSPWQRGTNENINDCLRFFFPKGCDFHKISDEEVQFATDIINNRPRKVLDLDSPADLFCCT